MPEFQVSSDTFVGPVGTLTIAKQDLGTRRLAMLIEGECELGPKAAAEKFGLSRQRYFQLRQRFKELGIQGLDSHHRGPKQNYRRTTEVVRQIIRLRFLDPDASASVIAQKLQQNNVEISTRSVERVIQEYGLQKKSSTVMIRKQVHLSKFNGLCIAHDRSHVIH